MEEYLYQKEYVMLNNMQLHLSNPEPMLKYIDEKVEKLIKAKSKNEEINIKLEILRHTVFSLIMLILFLIASLIEVFISINFLKVIIKYF